MAGSTISGIISHGITLGGAAYLNPLTITTTGGVNGGTATAIYSALAATVTNAGKISSADGAGIVLHTSGVVSNLAGGKIIALDAAIAGNGGSGTVTVDNSGLIEVTGTKVVTTGTVTFAPTAIDLLDSGVVNNSSTGTIIGGGLGVFLQPAATANVSLFNAGLITAGNSVFVHGLNTYASGAVHIVGGAAVTNAITGTLSGTEVGIQFGNTLSEFITLSNSGLIQATGTTVVNNGATEQDVGVFMNGAGTITNQSTGRILGFDGAYVADTSRTTAAYLNNLGSITGSGNSGIILGAAGRLSNSGHITGQNYAVLMVATNKFANQAGGHISGGKYGVLDSGAASYILNKGSITGQTGVLENNSLSGVVTIINDGIVNATESGIGLFETFNLAGEGVIKNAGVIETSATVEVSNSHTYTASTTQIETGATLINQAGGTITGPGFAVSDFNVAGTASVSNAGLISGAMAGIIGGSAEILDVTNSGTILSSGGEAVNLGGGGTLINASQGVITAATAFDVTGGGTRNTISNAGHMTGANGIGLFISTATTATIINTGTIATKYDAINLSQTFTSPGQGIIENFGLLETTATSELGSDGTYTPADVSLETGGTLINAAGGTIISPAYAVSDFGPAGTASVSNAGLISGAMAGVTAGATELLDITNSGSIVSSKETAVQLQGGAVTNLAGGHISGATGIGLYGSLGVNVSVNNAGTIFGTDYGITVFTGAQTVTGGSVLITNSGVIESTALRFINGSGNSATGAGILIGTGGNIINNAGGTIIGYDGIASYKTKVTISNAGYIGGLADFEAVYIGAGGSINNSGTLFGLGAATAGIYTKNDAVNITNSGTIKSAENSGIKLNAGGSLTNTGHLTGLDTGIYIKGLGTVINSGSIGASGTRFTPGTGSTFAATAVFLAGGGTLTNLAGGKIIATEVGAVTTGFASINNAGLIEGTNTSLITAGTVTFAGIGLEAVAGGSVTNTGSIIGVQLGVILETSGSAHINLTNSGLIEGAGTTFTINGGVAGSSGIYLADGGTITNNAGGTVAGYGSGINGGIDLGGAKERGRNATLATSIVNSGIIEGGVANSHFVNGTVVTSSGGVALNAGGALTNEATGVISGHFGVYLNGGSASIVNSITNFGTIEGLSNTGVILGANARLTNSGHVSGTSYGAFLYAANSATNLAGGTVTGILSGLLANNTLGLSSTVDNAGAIIATGTTYVSNGHTFDAIGVEILQGGTLVNSASGSISGFFGAVLEGNVTATNAGTISGRDGLAVYFTGSSELIIDPGAVFGGGVVDASGNGALVLAAGTKTGVFAGFGTQFTGFSALTVKTGAEWDIAGATTIAATVAFTNDGTIIETGSDALKVNAAITGAGTIILDPTTVTLAGSVAAGQNIDFVNTGDVLVLADASQFKAVISNFTLGDSIDLSGTTISASKLVTLGASGVLTIGSSTESFAGGAGMLIEETSLSTGIKLTEVAAPASVTASSTLAAGTTLVVSGAATIANFLDNGTVVIGSGESLDVSTALNPASSGVFMLTTKGSLEIASVLGSTVKMQFLGTSPANRLIIDKAASFGTHVGTTLYAGPLLEDFANGDSIDLKGIADTSISSSYATVSGDLQISKSGVAVATLQFQNSSLGAGSFSFASDGAGGLLVTR